MLNAIVTNIHLKYYGILETNLCTFCELEKENYHHLFYECTKVKPIWELITLKLNLKNLGFRDIWINDIGNDPRSKENGIVLFTKFYIYRTLCLKERLLTTSYVNFLKNMIQIEEEIAKNKGKLALHKQQGSHLASCRAGFFCRGMKKKMLYFFKY